MKNLFVLIILIFVLGIFPNTFAQEIITKGIVGGLNLANVTGDAEDTEFRFGFAFGGFLSFKISEQFSIRPEIYYSSKGFAVESEYSYSTTTYQYSSTSNGSLILNYFEIPILGAVSITENLNILAGPGIDLFLNGETKMQYSSVNKTYDGTQWITHTDNYKSEDDVESSDINSPGFGLIVGAEYTFKQFVFNARYSFGLTSIPDDNDNEFRHSVFQFMVGYCFK